MNKPVMDQEVLSKKLEPTLLQPDNHNKKYESLFNEIDTGQIKLPMFQREFVWDKEQSAKLFKQGECARPKLRHAVRTRDGEIDLLFEDHPEKRREFGSDEMVPAEALVEILPFDPFRKTDKGVPKN